MICRPRAPLALIPVLCLLLLSGSLYASGKTSFNLGHFNNMAMNGYDVMSYWRGGKPMEGDERFRYEYGGASWLFTSQQHKYTFAANPENYAPQYGGYCAYAAAQGQLADVDPFAWRIWDGQLYLNYSPRVRRIWASDIDDNILKANDNWPGIDPAASN